MTDVVVNSPRLTLRPPADADFDAIVRQYIDDERPAGVAARG